MTDADKSSTIAKYLIAIAATTTVTVAGISVVTWRDVGFNTRAISSLEADTARAITRLESDVRSLDATVATIASQTNENAVLARQREKEADQCAARVGQLERDVASVIPRAEKAAATADAERAEIRGRLDRVEQSDKSGHR